MAETELRRRLAQVSLIDYIRVMADDGGTTVALFDASGTREGASGAPQPPADARNRVPWLPPYCPGSSLASLRRVLGAYGLGLNASEEPI